MQAYQAGVSALRLSLKDVTVERAESLVDQIQEVTFYSRGCAFQMFQYNSHLSILVCLFFIFNQLCDTQDEVNQTISSGVTGAGMLLTAAAVISFNIQMSVMGKLIIFLPFFFRWRHGRVGGGTEIFAGRVETWFCGRFTWSSSQYSATLQGAEPPGEGPAQLSARCTSRPLAYYHWAAGGRIKWVNPYRFRFALS